MRIETPESLPDAQVEDFLKLYRSAFEPMEVLAAARQSLTDDEFVEELTHPATFKMVCYDDADRAVGLSFMTNDLTTVQWISIPYYQARFPQHFARKAIYYNGALLVHPDYQGTSAARLLLEAVFRKCGETDAVCAFDCCGFNVDSRRFPQMIADIARSVCRSVDTQEIDVQRYYAYVTEGSK